MLHQAARLAVMGHGSAEPNPLVGCIIVNPDGAIVGEGFHELFGEAHAEINALNMAGTSAIGATAYITLEPCNHHGKTPPCSEALLRAGIARVVIGTKDPNNEASGGGSYLQEHGVEVTYLNDEICNEIIAPFEHKVKKGLPWITCKWAQTVDGCIETAPEDSNWISCEESQQLVHEERGCVDAIVVGIGTVIHDDPLLTVRNAKKYRTPIRVVIDPNLRTPLDSNVLNEDAKTIIATTEGTDSEKYIDQELIFLQCTDGVLQLEPLFRHLHSEFDATHVLVEGGARLFNHLFNQHLVNELWVFTSPKQSTITPSHDMNAMIETLPLTLVDEQPSGVDTVKRYLVLPTK